MKVKCKCGFMGIPNTKCRKCSNRVPPLKKEPVIVEEVVVIEDKEEVEEEVEKVDETEWEDFDLTKSEEEKW